MQRVNSLECVPIYRDALFDCYLSQPLFRARWFRVSSCNSWIAFKSNAKIYPRLTRNTMGGCFCACLLPTCLLSSAGGPRILRAPRAVTSVSRHIGIAGGSAGNYRLMCERFAFLLFTLHSSLFTFSACPRSYRFRLAAQGLPRLI